MALCVHCVQSVKDTGEVSKVEVEVKINSVSLFQSHFTSMTKHVFTVIGINYGRQVEYNCYEGTASTKQL